MQNELFSALAGGASSNERSLITRAVGRCTMERIFGNSESSFTEFYESSGGNSEQTLSVLPALQSAFETIDFEEMSGSINQDMFEKLPAKERALIERAIGTAFWESTAAGKPQNLTLAYVSIGGRDDNSIERFEALQSFFDQVDFSPVGLAAA